MLEEDEVKTHLEAAGRDYVVDVRIRSYDQAVLLYIPRERVGKKVKDGYTSLRQINNLKKHLAAHFSTDVEVVFITSDSHYELESGFFQILNRRFGNRIKSFYISFVDEQVIDAWIEVQGLSDSFKSDFVEYYSELLEGAGLALGDIQWVGAKINLPTTPAILRLIKVLQPVNVMVLADAMEGDYYSIDQKWLTKTLDNLRRKGLVHWQKPGNYCLTADALALVPSGTRRSSSDVDRALALARRKW